MNYLQIHFLKILSQVSDLSSELQVYSPMFTEIFPWDISRAFQTYKSQTEFMVLAYIYPIKTSFFSTDTLVKIVTVHPVMQVRELGVFLDIHLSLTQHTQSIMF